MAIAVRVIGIVLVFAAAVYLVKPDVMKRILEFFKKGNRLYIAGSIRFALAIVFLLGASRCQRPWVIIAFGILLLIGGLLIFVLGPEKLRGLLEWWQRQPVLLLRVIALIFLVIGAIIVYSA
jgi:uncharacterized protein YjeT (DUF2065 family)